MVEGSKGQTQSPPGRAPFPACLCRDLRAPLERFFLSRGCSPAMAEDLTQDVFVRVLAYPHLNLVANPRAFIYRTATNLLLDSRRAERCRPTASLDVSTAAAVRLVDPITPMRILEGREDIELVSQALSDLETRTQRMFVMHRIDRLRHREIAAHFGLSVSLVEKCLRAAQRHLLSQYRLQRLRKGKRSVTGALFEVNPPAALRTVPA